MTPSNLICPICVSNLTSETGTLKCDNNHSYDISSSGYVNLLNPGKKNNFKSGDSKEMVKARTEFLNSECYRKASETLTNIIYKLIYKSTYNIENPILIDAGCGEGYYTLNIAKSCENLKVIGFDASKYAVEHAAKTARKSDLSDRAFFAAANIFSMPIADESCGFVVNLFAPEADEEFLRILKSGGFLIVGAAGVHHLYELKEVLYGENARLNDARDIRAISGFFFEEKITSSYKIGLSSNQMIKNLFKMTPYYHKTSNEDKLKLDEVESLEITVDFNFFVYRKLCGTASKDPQ